MNIKFVQIVVAADYHDIEYIADSLVGLELSTRELGMCNGQYVGVIFEGSCPGDGEISDLLLECGVIIDG